jgi:hypothetical protein
MIFLNGQALGISNTVDVALNRQFGHDPDYVFILFSSHFRTRM